MEDPERDKLVIDFRPRFTPPDAVKILAVAAEMGLPPNVLIRVWVKDALRRLEGPTVRR
jgi:hypothetical protein